MTTPPDDDARRDRMTFYPVIVLAALFCVTIFMVIAATFGDPANPANRWMNANANSLLIGESILLVVAAVAAMTIDRVRTLRQLGAARDEQSHTTQTDEERTHVG